jgi:hypothetical protein
LFAVKVVGPGDKQIRDPPENFSPCPDILLLNGGFKLVDERLMAWPNLLASAGIPIPPIFRIY